MGQENLTAPENRLLTFKEAAARLGMSEEWLRKLVARKGIDHHKLGKGRTGRVRFSEQQLDDYLQANLIQSEAR